MNYRTYFTSKANQHIDNVISYLLEVWGTNSKKKFLNELNRCVSLISNNPRTFPSHDKEIRRCLITPHNTMFYISRESNIYVLAIWDNRMDITNLNKYITKEY